MTDDDVQDIAKALVAKAKSGDVQAAREVFDRLLGKSPQALNVDMGVGPRDYQFDEEELIAEAERLDQMRIEEGLPPVFYDVLPAAARERREKQIAAEAGGG